MEEEIIVFNDTFYPTPMDLAHKISNMIDWKRVNSIVDPSAGKGDLLTGVLTSGKYNHYNQKDNEENTMAYKMEHQVDAYAIEIDPALRGILNNIRLCNGYSNADVVNVIGSDFLSYSGYYDFDCIVMNPPFDQGCQHLLRALEVIRCGQLFCILNRETIDNPFSKSRQLLKKKIEEYGGEIIDLGNPFTTAERKTQVSCVLVKFNNIDKGHTLLDIDFDAMKIQSLDKDFIVDNQDEKYVVERNDIKISVASYRKEIEAYKECLRSISKFRFYGGQAFKDEVKDYTESYNTYIKEATSRAWERLISLPRFTRFMTQAVRKKFYKQISMNSTLEFNEENIAQFLEALVYSFENIMYAALEDIFNKLTSYDKQNKECPEGWWTNDAYKVNRKVILPYIWQSYVYDGKYHLDYRKKDFLNDIDKVMMWLTGDWLKDTNNPSGKTDFVSYYENGLVDTVEKNKDNLFNIVHDSHFFTFRLYKKPYVCGTIHLSFKDEQVWQLFNMKVAEKKNWLPDDYKARYKENTQRGLYLEYKE
jgi:hypothetical protein